MKWIKKEIDSSMVREISARYTISLFAAAIFVRRGITNPEEILFYLENDLRFQHSPFLFNHMEDAVDRIRSAVAEGERVLVFGDRDADGITALTLMVGALRQLGLEVDWRLPLGDDPYGLTNDAIDEFHKKDGTLILTVDCGISCRDEIAYAHTLGIDTLVLDHHKAPAQLPDAAVIINPKVTDCGYPFKDLAGCGVVYKVIWALKFSESEIYNTTVCLLHAYPGNGTVIIEAVKLTNLVETGRIVENLVPGVVSPEQTRLFAFLESQEILVYGEEIQHKLLKKAFGNRVDIGLVDISAKLWEKFPALKDKSLLQIREKSRIAHYREKQSGEIDVLSNLFISYVLKQVPPLVGTEQSPLDLVALGTVADLMPLRGENRLFVKEGLKIINSKPRKGLQELLFNQNLLNKNVSAKDIAWQITPVINATGRMGQPDKAATLLLEEAGEGMNALAKEVIDLNNQRKQIGEQAWEKILDPARESFEKFKEKFVLVADEEVHRGITGILAVRLVNLFNVPAMVIAVIGDKAVGSVRSLQDIPIIPILDQCSDLLTDYGGHDFAAGFNLGKTRLDEFIDHVGNVIERMDFPEGVEPQIEIDAEIPLSYLTPETGETVELFAPYGEENPELRFMTKKVRILELDLIGRREQKHVKLLLDAGKYKWPAVFWNSADRVGKDFEVGDEVDLLYHIGKNFYHNRESLQLTILDIKRC
jgi:single-stranded-DNA-specific exonuclease